MKPISDPYGYDQHELMRSYIIPTAAAVILIGFAASAFLSLLPVTQGADEQVIAVGLDKLVKLFSKDLVDMSFSQSHIASSLALVSCIIIGLVITRFAHEDNQEYMEAYPYIEDVYSSEQKAAARKSGRLFALLSLPFFVAWVVLLALGTTASSAVLHGLGFLALACAVWLLFHGLHVAQRTDIFLYNFRALDYISIYELEADKDAPARKLRLAEKRCRKPIKTAKRVVITAGFLVALGLYALPSIETPFYWVAIVVAFVISAIIGRYSKEKVKKLAESMGDTQA